MKNKIEIIQVGNPIIRKKSKKVKFPLSKDDKKIIRELESAMGELVGISAPQIGVSKKILIAHARKTKFGREEVDEKVIMVNPKITRYSRKKIINYEGCGSVASANIFGKVSRSQNIDVEYFTEEGEKKTEKFVDFMAVIIQHEYDHLDGIIFLDRMKDMSSIMSLNEYMKMKKKKNLKK